MKQTLKSQACQRSTVAFQTVSLGRISTFSRDAQNISRNKNCFQSQLDGRQENQSHLLIVNVFVELSCFFDDPTGVGNLISDSSAFSKSSLSNWKFIVHVVLKPSLENFEHYFASM